MEQVLVGFSTDVQTWVKQATGGLRSTKLKESAVHSDQDISLHYFTQQEEEIIQKDQVQADQLDSIESFLWYYNQ